MRKGIQYLAEVFRLLKVNIGTLLVFELLYKFCLSAIFKPVLHGIFQIAMKINGLSYLTDETIGVFAKSPITWFFLAVIVLGLTIFTLYDICCIIVCIHAGYHQQKLPLVALLQQGLHRTLRVVRRGNFLIILYLLIIIPMTHMVFLSGYFMEFNIPEFITAYIFSKKWLMVLYVGFWVFMGWRSFHWIYSLHYFCLEKCNFKEARRRSIRLQKNHYWIDLILIVVWNLALIGAYYGVITFGAFLVSRANSVFGDWDMFCSLTLSGISLLLDVTGAAFYCFNLPLEFVFIAFLFYYRKKDQRRRIAGPLQGIEESYRVLESSWGQKLLHYRKRIIAIAVAVVLAVNFAYNLADKKGMLSMNSKQEVQVTAHRGYSAEYPENTIPAFKGAIEIGADWIELDVQQTKDGELIVLHDSNLKRTTGVDAEVWEMNWSDISGLDAGSWFDKKYQAIGIPTLEQVLKLAQGKIHLNIELKPTGHEVGLEKQVTELIEKYHMREYCVVSSLKYECLEKVKQADSHIETVYIASVSYGDFSDLDAADGLSVESRFVTSRFVKQAHKAGKQVLVWTVNSEDTLESVISLGVDNVITDDPVMAEKIIFQHKHTSFWDNYIDKLLKISN